MEVSEFAEGYFLQLLAAYPVSMCDYNMTDNLKLIITLFYSDSKESVANKISDWEGYTYDDLALIFDRSKQTIFTAVKQKENEAKEILEEYRRRTEARQEARKQLIEEEKAKMRINEQVVVNK